MTASDRRKQFEQDYEDHARALYSWAELKLRGSLRAHLDPDDFLQEVWSRAFEALDRYDKERSVFRAWLFTIARNVLLEGRRKLLRTRAAGGLGPTTRLFLLNQKSDHATRLSERLARDESIRVFLQQVEELPADDRKLVVGCGLEGRPASSMGGRLGLSAEAASKRWQRLRTELRQKPWARELIAL